MTDLEQARDRVKSGNTTIRDRFRAARRLDQVMDARDVSGCLYRINKRGGFTDAALEQRVDFGFAVFGVVPEMGHVRGRGDLSLRYQMTARIATSSFIRRSWSSMRAADRFSLAKIGSARRFIRGNRDAKESET